MDRLFVPLKSEHFENFRSGEKTWELRGVNPRFNTDTVYEGRKVELRKGYSGASIWGVIEEVKTFDSLTAVADDLDHEKIVPGASQQEFLEGADEMLGKYDAFITFKFKAEKQS